MGLFDERSSKRKMKKLESWPERQIIGSQEIISEYSTNSCRGKKRKTNWSF